MPEENSDGPAPLMFTGIQILEPRIFDYIPRGVFSHSTTDVYPQAIANGETVAFGRVVTDGATFGWLADVLVLPAHRGNGLGKALVRAVVSDPELDHLDRLVLATRDAHGLYVQYGFALDDQGRFMERRRESAT